uniref:Lysozyme n=1 Tax=Acrobeloides nanus TaxID=290746 RepID=A0A914E0Z2_9BILA
MTRILLPLLAFFVLSCYADIAIDTDDGSAKLSVAQFDCLYEEGDRTYIALLYDSNGVIDPTGLQNLENCGNAHHDYDNIQILINPCSPGNMCSNNLTSAKDQANEIIALTGHNNLIPTLIGVHKNGWPSSNSMANQNFLNEMIDTFLGANYTFIGIQTSYNSWSSVMGNKFSVASKAFLWWVNWNGKQDLTTGFAPFGGWSAPIAHQYAGKVTTDKCAPGVNINYSYYVHGTFQKKNGNKKFMSRI